MLLIIIPKSVLVYSCIVENKLDIYNDRKLVLFLINIQVTIKEIPMGFTLGTERYV